MRQEKNWYEVVNGSDLEQGDILSEIPVFDVPEDFPIQADSITTDLKVHFVDAIIVSQSCDLRHAGKIDFIALCPVYLLENFPKFQNAKERENLRQGRYVSYHLLNSCSLPGLEVGLMVVEFKRILSLPISLAQKIASDRNPRLRLKSPYKEHFSQGFARYFMRVGLPQDIPPFE